MKFVKYLLMFKWQNYDLSSREDREILEDLISYILRWCCFRWNRVCL